MLSQTVEYALRAAVYLAGSSDRSGTLGQIAAATRVPPAYLSKVLQSLARGGIVISRRGLHGGFVLARMPESISILEVVTAVDPIRRIRECPLGIASHGTNLCPLHHRLDSALASVEQAFARTTLAEVLAEPGRSVPLCSMPALPAR